MDINELANFLLTNVPTFQNIQILQSGRAFHYTSHSAEILDMGRFLGAPIDNNLDQTQDQLNSPAATSDPGVVFAYENESVAREEGFGADIMLIEYDFAIKAIHSQEALLGAPPTIIILNRDITSFTVIS